MEAIKDAIEGLMQALEAKRAQSPLDAPENILTKLFNKKELAHIKFNYLRKGILTVNVDSSSWLYHLSLRKDDLLSRLRQKDKAIKEIRFRIGEVE
ncbi:MAG TPA: DciA family protein [Candidatus Omnitrophota bacterium]|nr:DciA family protein [Candidatus Omnitrophota bacterium]